MLAAVYCGIINPLLRPGLFTKKEGNSLNPFFYEYIKKFNIKNFDEILFNT